MPLPLLTAIKIASANISVHLTGVPLRSTPTGDFSVSVNNKIGRWSQDATRCMRKLFMPPKKALVPVGRIEQRILLIRGEKVIIDADLAQFYGVPTKWCADQEIK